MLVAMLQANDELSASHDVLMKEMAFYLMAGAHTSIHSMTHAVHEFLEWVKAHPEDRQRADDDQQPEYRQHHPDAHTQLVAANAQPQSAAYASSAAR